jgi:hypothetical protein
MQLCQALGVLELGACYFASLAPWLEAPVGRVSPAKKIELRRTSPAISIVVFSVASIARIFAQKEVHLTLSSGGVARIASIMVVSMGATIATIANASLAQYGSQSMATEKFSSSKWTKVLAMLTLSFYSGYCFGRCIFDNCTDSLFESLPCCGHLISYLYVIYITILYIETKTWLRAQSRNRAEVGNPNHKIAMRL